MGHFTNGVVVGVGISLLLAPQPGQETRRFLMERFRYLRGIPPENEELKQQLVQMDNRVQDLQQKSNQASQLGSNAQNYAQETARSINSMQSDLNDVAQKTGSDVTAARPTSSRRQNQQERQGQ